MRTHRAIVRALLLAAALTAGTGTAVAAEMVDVRAGGSYRLGNGPWHDVDNVVIRVPVGTTIEVRPTLDSNGNLTPGKCAGSDGIRHQTALWFHASCTA